MRITFIKYSSRTILVRTTQTIHIMSSGFIQLAIFLFDTIQKSFMIEIKLSYRILQRKQLVSFLRFYDRYLFS